MAEPVDAIIAQLEVRMGTYASDFQTATKVVDGHTAALKRAAEQEALYQGLLNRPKRVSQGAAVQEEQETTRIVSTRKRRSAEEVAADKAARDAEKATAREAAAVIKAEARERAAIERAEAKAAADVVRASEREKAAAARNSAKERVAAAREVERANLAQAKAAEAATALQARLDASAARRVIVDRTPTAAPAGALGGRSEPGARAEAAAQTAIMARTRVPGDVGAEVAVEKEVNHLRLDRFDLEQRSKFVTGDRLRDMQSEIEYLRRINTYKAAGLEEDKAIERATRETALSDAARAEAARKKSLGQTGRFFEAAGIGRTGGGTAAIAGLATAAVAGGVIEAVDKGLKYANELKEASAQLGITTRDLQVYQTAAEQAGVKTEQMRTAFGHASDQIGKAQDGAEKQGKLFAALGIDVGDTARGLKSFGDLLPTIVDRISSIKDPTQRATIETELFGEAGKKLDGLLSGGTDAINALGDGLERTGGILSSSDIQRAAKTSQDLKALGDQLERQLASTVSQNAAAIEDLATSLLHAASAALHFVDSISRMLSLSQLNNGDPEVSKRGLAGLLTSHEGRQAAFTSNTEALNRLNRGPGDPGLGATRPIFYVGGGVGSDSKIEPLNGYVKNTPEAIAAARTKLLEQRQTILRAEIADRVTNKAANTPVQGGSVDRGKLSQLDAPKPKKGRKGPKDRTNEITKATDDRLARLQEEDIDLQIKLTGSREEQLRLETGKLDREHAKRIDDLKRDATDKKIDAARLGQLIAAENQRDADARRVVQTKHMVEIADQTMALAEASLRDHIAELGDEQSSARTARQRRRLELAILKDERDIETARNDRIIASGDKNSPDNAKYTDEQRAEAQRQHDNQDERYNSKRRNIIENTKGPLDRYREELPRTAAQIDERFQQIAVTGLQSVNDQLTTSISKMLHLNGLAGSLLESFIRIGIERELIGPLADAAFGKAGGNSGSGSGGGLGGLLGGLFGHKSGLVAGDQTSAGTGALGHAVGNNALGAVTSFLSRIFGHTAGTRAAGGTVVGGQLYQVNEIGDEFFRPAQSGTIIPHNAAIPAAGGGVTLHQTVHIDASGVNPEGYTKGILGIVRRETGAAIRQANASTLAATPGVVREFQTLKG